ncbi:hypothetical protein Bbelb_413200 [Branchiostoma belcheri]|nr:hypothetical protein Bbelb_413200 [Branchiostoma belcheri]
MALRYLRSWWNSRKNGTLWTSEDDTDIFEKADSGTEESSSVDASSGTRSYSVLESADIDTDVLFMSQSSDENLTSESSSCDSYFNRQRGKDKDYITSCTGKAGTFDARLDTGTGEDSSSSNSRNTNTTADDEQDIYSEIGYSNRLQSPSRSHTDLVIPGRGIPCVWQENSESGVQSEMSHSSPSSHSQSSGDGTSWELASQTSGELSDSIEELSDICFIAEILQPCENCHRRLKEATAPPKTSWEEKSCEFRAIGDPSLIRTRTCSRDTRNECSSLATSSEFGTTESYTLSGSTSYCYTCTCDTCSTDESESDTCTMTWPPANVRPSPAACLPTDRTSPDERIAFWIDQNANHWKKGKSKNSQTMSKAGRFLVKFCTIRRKNITDKYRKRRTLVQSNVTGVSNTTDENVNVFSEEGLNKCGFHLCEPDGNNETMKAHKGWKKLNRNYRPLIAYEKTMFLESYGIGRLTEVGPVEPTTLLQTQNNRVRCESEHEVSSIGVKRLGRPNEGTERRVDALRSTSPQKRKLMIESSI